MNNSFMTKYLSANTYIHLLDPRAKLFFVIFYLISVFFSASIIEFFLLFMILFLALYLAKLSLSYLLSSFKVLLFLLLFTALVHLFFNQTGRIIFELLGFKLYSGAFYAVVLTGVRFFLVLSMMIILTVTTSPNEITQAIEKALSPLKFILPIESFALLLSISLRFIPTIAEETNRIVNAQISRGANFNTGSLMNRIKSYIPILLPIFIATLKRADELATAMEVRGYSPNKKRTRYKKLSYQPADYILYLIIGLLFIFIIYYK